MIIFDICSIPRNVDITTWYQLFKEGVVLFDSSLIGLSPQSDDKISLIDTSQMNDEDWNKVAEASEKINEARNTENKEALDTMRKNNQKLIDYLKKTNDENENK